MSYMTSLNNKLNQILYSSNQERIFFRTLPTLANYSYLINSSKFLAPSLFSKVCGKHSLRVSQILLATCLTGHGLFLLSQRHLKRIPTNEAIGYAAFGSVYFNFGSILIWMLSKTYLPDNRVVLFFYGIFSGMGLLYTAKSYTDVIDNIDKC